MSDVFTRGSILDERYEVERLLGGSGLGEVLLVRHLQLDEQRVAKILPRDLIGDRASDEQFQREARIASRIKHANVATFYDCARLPEGSSYMVWEYVEGEDLVSRMRREPRLEVSEAVGIAVQTLSGLATIHGAGLVHQEVSPDNLLLTEDESESAQVKIIDLGLAWVYRAGDLSKLESTGGVVRKLAYCSPEQARVESDQPLDHRTDLYSLGLVLYEMLSGSLPFEGSSPQGLFLKRIHEDPIPLIDRVPDLPHAEELSAVLQRALARQRDARYPNAVALIEALAPFVDGGVLDVQSALEEAAAREGSRLAQAIGLFERYLEEGKPELARMTLETVEEMAPGHARLDDLKSRLQKLKQSTADRQRLQYLVDSGHQALQEGDLRQAERWLEMLRESAPQSAERRDFERELESRREERSRDDRVESHRERLESLLAQGDWESAERELDALSDLGVTRVTLQNYGRQLDTGREREEESNELEALETEYLACCGRCDWIGALDVARRLAATDLAPDRALAMSQEVRGMQEEERKQRAIRQGIEQLESFLEKGDARGADTALLILIGLDPDFDHRAEMEARVRKLTGK